MKTTDYFYDTDSGNRESSFQTNNNRLLKTEERWGSGNTLKRTVEYKYYNTGHAERNRAPEVLCPQLSEFNRLSASAFRAPARTPRSRSCR